MKVFPYVLLCAVLVLLPAYSKKTDTSALSYEPVSVDDTVLAAPVPANANQNAAAIPHPAPVQVVNQINLADHVTLKCILALVGSVVLIAVIITFVVYFKNILH